MSQLLMISGSPSAVSRSSFLALELGRRLADSGHAVRTLAVRDLPAQDVLHARSDSPAVLDVIQQVAAADAVVIATPIYKAAYSGLLKALLDLLPRTALLDKVVLPLATGGSAAHFLAVDYALKPVLAALGARHVLSTVYATDAQLIATGNQSYEPDAETASRLEIAAAQLVAHLRWARDTRHAPPAEYVEPLRRRA